MYPITFDSNLTVIHYDIDITPETTPAIRKMLFRQWAAAGKTSANKTTAKLSQYCVFDGQKNMFCPGDLGLKGTEVIPIVLEKADGGKEQKFTIKIKIAATLDMYALAYYLENNYPTTACADIETPRDRISSLEVLLRHFPSLNYITYGKGGSFYSEKDTRKLREGLEVYFGWYQSLKPCIGRNQGGPGVPGAPIVTYKQLLLNMDVAATAFYTSGPLVDVIGTFFGTSIANCRDLLKNGHDLKKLETFLRGVNVEITYRLTGRRRYKIKRLSKDSVSDSTVALDEPKRTVTIAQFFKQQYNIQLKYPWLPCVICGTDKDVLLPMELVNVRPNQRHVGKLNELQTADMIKVTAVLPNQRKVQIQKGIEALHGKHDAAFLKSWGVEVSTEMSVIDARILPAPKMTIHPKSQGGHTNIIRDGQWRYGQGKLFAQPANLKCYGIAVFGRSNQIRPDDVANFFWGLIKTLNELGMNAAQIKDIMSLIVYPNPSESVEEVLKRTHGAAKAGFGAQKVDIIFCVLAGRTNVYADVKRYAEAKLGIMTQCCMDKHVRDDPARKKPYFCNIALKINAKLGGINGFLNPINEIPPVGAKFVPTMILGADVTHPPPGIEGKSIAALVGSMDPKYCEYRSSIRLQDGRQEIITELDIMVKELFMIFKAKTGTFPLRVLFYRDGVSEGQYGEVVYTEVMAMKRIFRELTGEKTPDLTFLVMSKRHHVRFFPKDSKDGDKNGNVLAGTVVDSTIVHPYEFDFYLNSHPGLQGTSRSAHYHVLFDENNFTPDKLQELTYRLCHLYCRATRVVSIVPAAYYAHLVAARARCYVEGLRGEAVTQEMIIRKVLPVIQNQMYFV